MSSNRPFRLSVVFVLALAAILAGLLGYATPTHAAAALSLSRNTAAPGDKVTVNGSGFHAGDDVVVSSDMVVNGKSQHVQTSTSTDGNGSFSAVLTVPNGTAQHTYYVVAKDFHGASASHYLVVVPLAYISAGAAPHLVYVIPMHLLYISGHGYKPGESITISAGFPQYNGNTVNVQRTAQADSKGNFYETLIRIPRDVKATDVSITATGNTSKNTGRDTLRVVYRPFLVLDAYTVRPGTSIGINGHEFVPNSAVRVYVTIPRNGDTTETLSRNVTTDGIGSFSVSLGLPSNVRIGKYSIGATDSVGGFRAFTTVQVSVNPSITIQPNTVFAGQSFNVSGTNFGSGVSVRVSATFPLSNGKNQFVAKTVTTGGRGGYSATLTVPGNASANKVIVTAASSNAHTSAPVYVRVHPTAVPATATAAPAATATDTPTASHHHHRPGFGYRYISVWYHTVRVGTYDHIVVQSTLHTQLGIWVHVYFPSGQHLDYYKNTTYGGKFEFQFGIPTNAISGSNNQVLVTFRLWHGKASVKEYAKFSLVH